MKNWSEANKYTLYGAVFGICFPVFSILFLFFVEDFGAASTLVEVIRQAHANSLLYVIDTAPLFLGLAARFAGIRQDRIRYFADSLEQQIYDKTESLRTALDESRKANELISHMADHDALTGLLNRRRFQDTLDSWLKYSERYNRQGTLLFLDLDKFKLINDNFGHEAGDHYLTSTANMLSHTLRATDMIARWGGDEFVAFLPETTGTQAHHVANKIITAFSEAEFIFGAESFQPSISVGLASVPEHTRDTHELVICADAAMYEAKKAGRGCWRIYGGSAPEIEHVQANLQWEARIRRALNNDQFLLLYQPLLNLKTGQTDGYEALLRMEDREGHLISPGLFLESAERANLSTVIDLMVIRKALRRVTPLVPSSQSVWVSVNLSAKTVQDKNLQTQIEAVLQDYPGQHEKIRFEIAEMTALKNMGKVREIAAQIKAFGCALILDDFGVGSTSMHYLEGLSVDMVKIHPSLTRDLGDKPKTQGIVKNMTDMLHGIQMEVAAKSVEDSKALELIRSLGMDYAQGFAIGRPFESIEQVVEAARSDSDRV